MEFDADKIIATLFENACDDGVPASVVDVLSSAWRANEFDPVQLVSRLRELDGEVAP